MLIVEVKKGNVGKALKILKKRISQSHIMIELRERRYYTKKSAKKRLEKSKAIFREKKRREFY